MRAHTILRWLSVQLLGLVTAITFSPIHAPSYPLAVRNPYLNTWLPGNLVENLPSSSPQFWTGKKLTWSVIAKVDGAAYSLFGVEEGIEGITAGKVTSAKFTSTHTIFTLTAGSLSFELDFFSPVSPSDFVRQSLPFSYLTVSVSGAKSNNIQIYTDIDDSWTSTSTGTTASFNQDDNSSFFSVNIADHNIYDELDDMAQWGSAILAAPSSSQVASDWGTSSTVRSRFAQGTAFAQATSGQYAAGGVVALVHDLGKVSTSVSTTFAVGYVREQAINYMGQPYTGYYAAAYRNTSAALAAFFSDYSAAAAEATTLDNIISSKATEVAGTNYSDICELSVRQAFGGIDITIPLDTLDTTEPFAFIKEISSDGNLNTIDIIAPAFPIYYVLNPNWIKYLLEPVMKYLSTGAWKQPYMIHDLGSTYPHAIGHDDQVAEPMPIEESGNILILAYAYQKATGDKSWAAQYTDLFQTYADYLVNNTLPSMANQLCSNDAAGPLPNQTGLAHKAAVGLKSFALLSGQTKYADTAQSFADQLYKEAYGTDPQKTHFTLEFNTYPDSWKVPYNTYPDILLELDLFPAESYAMSSTYLSQSTVRGQYGVPLQSGLGWAKSDWNMWTAATLSQSTQTEFVDDLWSFLVDGQSTWPFSDRYQASALGGTPGAPILCKNRPTVGGHFALLALKEGTIVDKADHTVETPQYRVEVMDQRFGASGEL